MTPGDRSAQAFADMSRAIRARHLQTDLIDAVWAESGETVGDVLGRLELGSFDQAPARREGHLVGFALTRRLKKADVGALVDFHLESLDESAFISADASVLDVMGAVADKPGVSFVIEGRTVTGFVTPSDLNKHQARTHFYLLLADLELLLALGLRSSGLDLDSAVLKLEADDRKKVRNRFRKDTALGLEVDLVAGMDLHHLMTIVGSEERLVSKRGRHSPASWEALTATLRTLRNDVMHPVNPFLKADRQIANLIEIEGWVEELLVDLRNGAG